MDVNVRVIAEAVHTFVRDREDVVMLFDCANCDPHAPYPT